MNAQSSDQASARPASAPAVCVGMRAPDFTLPCTRRSGSTQQRVSLADYRDRWLILLFYPRDFSMVCPTELTALSVQNEEFARRDCDILGVSTDPIERHQQWIASSRSQGGLGGLAFPLASDEDGSVCQAYGVYLPRQHMALRGLFIIDPNGVLQYQVVHNLSVGRRSDEVLRVLDGLQTGGLCPENWIRDEPTLDPTRALGPNSVIGQYRVEAQIGSGTFGVVFRARDLTLERTVALKIFRSGGTAAPRRLLEEARAAAALNHPNVCTVFAVDDSNGISMIVMEHVEGQPLKKLLEAGKLPLEDAKAIARQIALGMAGAHANLIVHGDLKPGNIMITPEGMAKIMDFGLAHREPRISPTDETGTWETADPNGLSGTPDYMSPEQARSEPATWQSDVFALGLIIYEMLTGQKAIRGGNLLSVLRQIDTLDPAQYAEGMPEPFATILRRSLIANPAERDITMTDIVELLEWRDYTLAAS
ncbi:MAG: redoxin domain-containing protein [Planctomycetia bacterium]|nr:redoxin domain-containing protein [Planctomycetia bacterium]